MPLCRGFNFPCIWLNSVVLKPIFYECCRTTVDVPVSLVNLEKISQYKNYRKVYLEQLFFFIKTIILRANISYQKPLQWYLLSN